MNNQVTHLRSARTTMRSVNGMIENNFLKLTIDVIEDIIKENQCTVNAMKQEFALFDNARLRLRKKDGRIYYGNVNLDTGKEHSITNDSNRIHLLARRSFLKKSIAATENQIKLLQKIANDSKEAYYEAQLYKSLSYYKDAGLDITRIIFTKEQNEWIDAPYSPNPYNAGSLKYETISKIPVRSTSERGLGNMFEEFGLPYRSDDIVRIIDSRQNNAPFRDSYFADFKVPNLLGGITIHEHLGAFHIENYADNALKRLNDYHNFTIIELPGRPVTYNEFTWSFESDLLDSNRLKRLIARLLLPGIC